MKGRKFTVRCSDEEISRISKADFILLHVEGTNISNVIKLYPMKTIEEYF